MIEQTGRVSRITGGRARIECRPARCDACMEGRGCGAGVFAALLNQRGTTIELEAGRELQPGDGVVLGLDERQLLRAAWRLYGVPLAGLLGGVLAGALVGGAGNDPAALVGGVAGLGLAFYFRRSDRTSLTRPTVLKRFANADH